MAAVFAVLLLRSARPRQQLQAPLASIPLQSVAALRPGQGLVRLKGVIGFLLGEGVILEGADRAAAPQAVGLPPALDGPVRAWALRAGQEITVVGTVQQKGDQTVIAKAKGQPLVVAPGDSRRSPFRPDDSPQGPGSG